jgi:murein DD-endopeptidase MepM/ murein hydrolase activator NlpD
MKYPVWKGYITQQFKSLQHNGTDKGWIRVGLTKPPIYSWSDGVCVQSTFSTSGGNGITIAHRNISKYHDYFSRYWHLDSRALKLGDKVTKGQIVGIGGTTGTNSTGQHLHFEIWIVPKGMAFNPTLATRYAIDSKNVTFIVPNQPFTGEGVKVMSLDLSKLPIAKPKFNNVRMRSTPTVQTSANILLGSDGKPIYVPESGLPFKGVTQQLIDGYKWGVLDYQGDEVWVAYDFLTVADNVKIVTVEKIVEVVKPLDISCVQDGVEVKLQVNELLK